MGVIAYLYDIMAKDYNDSVCDSSPSFYSKGLKSAHRELFFDLVRALKGNFAQQELSQNDTYKYGMPLIVATNRKRLRSRTLKSEATVYRLILRLIEAKILLKKINHGVRADFELYLNPDLIPISDLADNSFDAVGYIFSNTQNQLIKEALRSKCTPCSKYKNFLNNKIITKNDQEQEKVSPVETCYKEHVDSTLDNSREDAILTSSVKNEEELTYEQKLQLAKEKDEQMRRKYAVMFTEEIIEQLFSDRVIYPCERDKAYANAYRYFENYYSETPCMLALQEFRCRIDLVRRYLQRNKDFDFSNIWPASYLDVENYRSGFVMTKQWLRKHKIYKQLQQKQRKIKTEHDILNYAITKYQKSKNKVAARGKWTKYIQDKIPNKLEQFYKVLEYNN